MNSKTIVRLAAVLCTVLLLISYACSPVYFPNQLNVPLLEKEGDFVGTVTISPNGFDPQMAYAITSNVGVMANIQINPELGAQEVDRVFTGNFLAEAGVGYYAALSDIVRFEVFGGGGYGWVSGIRTPDQIDPGTRMYRGFVQPTLGISGRNAAICFSSRFTLPVLMADASVTRASFVEPAITLKLGVRQVKFFSQIGLAIPLSIQYTVSTQPLIFAVGMQFRFGTGDFGAIIQ
jgi:hypothetical protein